MFFDGLCEMENPYKYLALQGIRDMLKHGGSKIFPCIPQLVIPIKSIFSIKIRAKLFIYNILNFRCY